MNMKKVLAALSLIAACYACGGGGENTEKKPISNSESNSNNQIGGGANDSATNANNAPPATTTSATDGKPLIEASDCLVCHKEKEKVIGPSYAEVAKKYTEKDIQYLSEKIIKGGVGVWGQQQMTAHPQVSQSDAEAMVRYILTVK